MKIMSRATQVGKYRILNNGDMLIPAVELPEFYEDVDKYIELKVAFEDLQHELRLLKLAYRRDALEYVPTQITQREHLVGQLHGKLIFVSIDSSKWSHMNFTKEDFMAIPPGTDVCMSPRALTELQQEFARNEFIPFRG